MKRFKMGLSLRKCGNAKHISTDSSNINSNFNSVVWSVRLRHNAKYLVDHCILADARRKVIIDSAENFPIRLRPESLRLLSGENTPKIKVAKVKELVVK